MKNLGIKAMCCVFIMFFFGAVHTRKEAYADQASPRIHTLTQPDGTTFSARQFGDEWGGEMETTDGFVITQNQQGYWSYAVIDVTCRLVPSTMVVGKDDPVKLGVPKHVGPTEEIIQRVCGPKQSPEQPRRRMRMSGEPPRVVPQDRILSGPVLLIAFADTTPLISAETFTIVLSDTVPNFLKDYYQEVLEGIFREPTERDGVTGWYRAFYHDFYGQDLPESEGNPGDDVLAATLVRHAVLAADPVVNFANYDTNGDCYVDMVLVVHQGTGQEESHNPNDIWSHRWTLNDAMRVGDGSGEITTHDPCQAKFDQNEWMKVNAYTIVPETILQPIENADKNR